MNIRNTMIDGSEKEIKLSYPELEALKSLIYQKRKSMSDNRYYLHLYDDEKITIDEEIVIDRMIQSFDEILRKIDDTVGEFYEESGIATIR